MEWDVCYGIVSKPQLQTFAEILNTVYVRVTLDFPTNFRLTHSLTNYAVDHCGPEFTLYGHGWFQKYVPGFHLLYQRQTRPFLDPSLFLMR